MRSHCYVFILGLCLAATASKQAVAGIYTFTDANGVIHFTNKSSDPRYEKLTPVPYPTWPVRLGVPARSVEASRYNSLIGKAAREHQVDQALLQAVIAVESGYNPRAVSHKGAKGLMQLMPETARRYGVTDIFDPAQNIKGGAQYLRDLIQRFNNDVPLALAAYNAGEAAIVQYGHRIPPFRETMLYVPKVLDAYNQYRSAIR
jgi:soluble lytic murein transglycosylase-like protein